MFFEGMPEAYYEKDTIRRYILDGHDGSVIQQGDYVWNMSYGKFGQIQICEDILIGRMFDTDGKIDIPLTLMRNEEL